MTKRRKQKCWHCEDSGRCDCMTCGKDVKRGHEIKREPGACQSCEGRAFYERNREFLSRFNPLDRANWLHHPAADGNKVRREYVPLRGLK